MQRKHYILVGAISGLTMAILTYYVSFWLSDIHRKVMAIILEWIAYPVAILLSKITQQPLQAELSIWYYLVAIVISFIIIGTIIGWVVSMVRK